jgi:hypothetical protein
MCNGSLLPSQYMYLNGESSASTEGLLVRLPIQLRVWIGLNARVANNYDQKTPLILPEVQITNSLVVPLSGIH